MTRWYVTTQKASVLVGRSPAKLILARNRGNVPVEFRSRPALLSHDGQQFYVEAQPCRHGANSAAV